MANHQGVHLPVVNELSDIRRKKISGQQKRDELEREVIMLQNMLKQEEKFHEILELVKNKNDGSGFSIPNFIPLKARELLVELATVEGEIARLENQINQLQHGLKNEKEITEETKAKSKQWQPGSLANLRGHMLSVSFPNSVTANKAAQEKMGFDTKALHFISKAIKGDYNLDNFAAKQKIRADERAVKFSDQKENQFFQDEVAKFPDRIPRKSGFLKSPSPLHNPGHLSPMSRERNHENALDTLPKALSNRILPEENTQQWQPNKLSENILKCLNFIYIRLLRTSRATELEKSGPISRSLHSSLMARSFRADTSLSPKSSLVTLQKESRQQDPYGIFDAEESVPRDIGPYKNLVIFTSSSMDPKYISSPNSIPLLRKLRVLMSNLQTVDLKFLTHQQKLAFWINMCNACIMHGFLQYGVPGSPEKLYALMNKASLNIGGNTINAEEIEHYILRKPKSSNKILQNNEKNEREAIVRKLYGLELTDPNVTFALCYGTRSSPAVRVYTAEGVPSELEKAKLEYLQASVVVTSRKRIAIPELVLGNLVDFAMDRESLVEWVWHQLPTSGSLRKSIADCFRSHVTNIGKMPTPIAVEEIPYDFEFQYLLAI